MNTSFGNLLSQSFSWFKLPELFLQEEMRVAGTKILGTQSIWTMDLFYRGHCDVHCRNPNAVCTNVEHNEGQKLSIRELFSNLGEHEYDLYAA